jgi:two-component system, chemotaxis family, sensor kinase Cph1
LTRHRGEGTPKIHVSAERNAGAWPFPVQDNGIGIAPPHADWVFGVFERGHGKEIPGTGIGPALCKKVVERRPNSRS